MRRVQSFLTLVFPLLSILPYAIAIPSRPLDLASLTEHADVIVIGKITSVVERSSGTLDLPSGPVPATQFQASLLVDRVLKGTYSSQTMNIQFLLPEAPMGIQGARAGQYGIFFLQTDQGNFKFSDLMHPYLPSGSAALLPQTGSPLDLISIALGAVLTSPQSSLSDQIQALHALARSKTLVSANVLAEALKNTTGDLHLRIAAALTGRGDITGLQSVEAALSHPATLSSDMRATLAGSLAGLSDPRAIPALARLFATGDAETRRGAIIGLRQTGSSGALSALSRGLNDSDLQVRYYAVVGLGEITRQDEWTPAFAEFEHNEAHYLSYWRNWAKTNL